MSREKNKTHRKNRIKKEMAFRNTKASFVAGIVVIIIIFNDTFGLLVSIPRWVELTEVAICLLMFFLVLGTKKLNHILHTIGVEKFGGFLTVYSVIIFLLEKIIFDGIANVEFRMSLTNEKAQIFIVFLALGLVGVGGSIYLLLYKYPKES